MDLVFSLGPTIAVNIAAWLTPGPNMLAVMRASMTLGRTHGLATGLGLAFGALIWATSAVLGAAMLFDLFPKAVMGLKLTGAAYLVWLGFQSIGTAGKRNGTMSLSEMQERTLKQSFRSGFIVSITNPKAALFSGSVMTAFLPAAAPNTFLALIVLICGLLAVILHSVTATVFSTRIAINFFHRFHRTTSYAFGIIFASLGASIAYAALRRTP